MGIEFTTQEAQRMDNVPDLSGRRFVTTAELVAGYVPYTGATSGVDLGSNGLSAGSVGISGTLTDNVGSAGDLGWFLKSTGSGFVWQTPSTYGVSNFANDAGYLTSFSETDTLATVTARGASTATHLTFSGGASTTSLAASGSGGVLVESNSGTDVALFGAGGGSGATFYGGVIMSTMTAGSMLFACSSGLISQDNANLFWDDSSNRLGIGTSAAPSTTLHVISTSNQMRIGASTTGYWNTSVGSTGIVSMDAVGSGASFRMSDPLTVSSASATIPAVTANNDGSGDRFGFAVINMNSSGAVSASAIQQFGASDTLGFTRYSLFVGDQAGSFKINTGAMTPTAVGTERITISNTGLVTINETGADADFRVEGDTLTHMIFTDASSATENIALLASGAPNWQSMDGGIFIGNASAVPSGNPSSGGFLYVESGALKFRGSSGTVTTIAAA